MSKKRKQSSSLPRLRSWFEQLRDRESYNRHDLVGPAGVWRIKRRFQIDFLRRHGLKPDHTLVDIGCGTLRGGIPLIKYLEKGNYVGLDVRPEVLTEAKNELMRYKLGNKQPTLLHCKDFSTLPCDKSFDFAWAFAVLIHMADDICISCLRWTKEHLLPDGVFFADVNLGKHNQRIGYGMGSPFPIITRPLDEYEGMAESVGLASEDMGCLAEHGHKVTKRHMLRFRLSQ